MDRRDWIPVAPTWERDPEDRDIWRRVVTMPSLALNRAEQDFLGDIAGRQVCVLSVGDGMAPLALAALGARVTVIDSTATTLDVLVVRTQVVGVELEYAQVELSDLSSIPAERFQVAYAAQAAGLMPDLLGFYSHVFRILSPGGRFVINEYHPFRRIWKPEPGPARLAHSYFERRRERTEPENSDPEPATRGIAFSRYQFHWTVSDHCSALTGSGFRIAGLEEVGDTRQAWELPNLGGLPEQLVVAADKPDSSPPAAGR